MNTTTATFEAGMAGELPRSQSEPCMLSFNAAFVLQTASDHAQTLFQIPHHHNDQSIFDIPALAVLAPLIHQLSPQLQEIETSLFIRGNEYSVTLCCQFSNDRMVGGFVDLTPIRCNLQLRQVDMVSHDPQVGFWEIDLADGKTYWSRQLYRIYDLDYHCDPTNLTELDRFTSKQKESIKKCIHKAKSGIPCEQEVEVFEPDGTSTWVLLVYRPVFDSNGNVERLRGYGQVVTDNYYERERYAMAIEAAKLGIWEVDFVNKTSWWNSHVYNMFGIPEGEKIEYYTHYNYMHPEDRDEYTKRWLEAKSSNSAFSCENRIIPRNSNKVRYLHFYARFYSDQNGPNRCIGICLDITEQKERSIALLKERQQQFERSKLVAVGELAGGIGHEINNPLTIAMANVAQLGEQFEALNNLSAAGRTALTNILDEQNGALQRIANLTSGLRRLVRNESEDEKTQVNLCEVVDTAAALVREIFSKQGITLSTKTEPAFVLGHFSEIQQVLLNLLNNAKESLADRAERRISVKLKLKDQVAKIVVTDTGCGMSKALLKRVQAGLYTTKDAGHGTGLGLAITQRIVNQHDGTLSLTSKEGQGTKVTVSLPCVQQLATTTVDRSEATSNQPWAAKLKVLAVDDEPMLAKILGAYVGMLGASCTTMTSGLEAIEYARGNPIDLLITDVTMPEITGGELIERIRKIQPEVRAVVATGGGGDAQFKEAYIDGMLADEVIYKPFQRNDVWAAVKAAMAKKLETERV